MDGAHQLNDAQRDVLAQLGAPPAQRPEFEPGLRDELRHELESALAPTVRALGEHDTLVLSKRTVEDVHGCEARFLADGEFAWTAAMARGVVAHRAIELAVTRPGSIPPLDLVDEAIALLVTDGFGVGDFLQRADEQVVDQIRAEANTYLCKYLDCWPPLERRWRPATEVSLRAELFEGRVVLVGRPDLTVGRSEGTRAGKVVVDFKTGAWAPGHRADLRFYALVDTLRVGTPPRLLVTSYLDSGRLDSEAVTLDVLHAEVRRTADAGAMLVELRRGGRDPVRRPGPACRWCPIAADCGAGREYLEAVDGDW